VVARDALAELEVARSGVRHYGPDGQPTPEDLDSTEITVFIESWSPPPQMIIFGAVDFTAALAKIPEIEASMTKQFNTAFGGLGGLKQMIQKLQTETPVGQTIDLSDEDFEDLKREYPEMADYTIKGLRQVFGKFKGSGGADPAGFDKKFDEKVQTAVADIRQEIVKSSLEAVFPGWEEDVKTPQFDEWVKAQPPEMQARMSSDKLSDAAKMLKAYYAHVAAPPPPAPTPTSPPVNTRQRQLAAAVPPRGDGGHPPAASEDDDFEQGFKYRSRSG
jgi:hypothetical protein